MSKIEFDFSFRRDISQIRDAGHSTLSSSLPKDFSGYGLSLNNTSRFEEKKVLRKLRDQELLNRMYYLGYSARPSCSVSARTNSLRRKH